MKTRADQRAPGLLLPLALLAGFLGPATARHALSADGPVTGLSLVGRTVLPRDLEHEGTRVGGLSGLAFDEASGAFWAISDDRGQHGPVRAYRLRIDIQPATGGSKPPAPPVTIEDVLVLKDAKGRPFAEGAVDTEGISLVPGGFLVSTEAIPAQGVPAVIAEHGADGRVRRELSLPSAYRPGPGRGVRENLGFEGLAPARDGRHLFAAVENALAQDGPVADAGVPSPARILRFALDGTSRPAEFVYVVEPVTPVPPNTEAFRVNGLSDVLPTGTDRLLVLERQFVAGLGNAVRLYDVSLEGATDVSSLESLHGASFVPAKKALVLDLSEVGIPLENYEGMTFGPRLPDGRDSLILVSDDNFNPAQEATTFLVFAIERSPMTISRIQGAGHVSPHEGEWVIGVPGVVTSVDRDPRSTGFWLESDLPDGDPATSEGIFVLHAGAASLVPGQAVAVSGRVEEATFPKSLPVTRLRAYHVGPRDGSRSLPPPVRLFSGEPWPSVIDGDSLTRFDPATGALDRWESLEGMRVEIPGGTVVGPSSGRGDFTLRPDGAPAVPRTLPNGVLLPREGPSFDRVFLGTRLSGPMPAVDVGARVKGPVTGIVDYAFSSYRVWTLSAPVVDADGAGCEAGGALRGDGRHLTIGSFNVENLTVAGPADRFAKIGDLIARGMKAPDLVALQEVQDDSGPGGKMDGVVTSRKTLDALVAGISAAGGPRYEAAWIDPVEGREGGQPGGNIRVAFLLNPARVTLVRRGEAGPLDATEPEGKGRDLRLTLSPGRVAPGSAAFTLTEGEGVRRSLALELRFRGKPLFVVGNHWSSKSDDDRAFGPTQPPRTPTAPRRLAQAVEIRGFVDRLLAADPEARVVVLGDLNDFEHSDPVRLLAAPPLENLILRVPAPDRYTYNFEGASQVLDHVVVSPSLATGAAVEVLHVNSDCSNAKRTSDHDPVVVRLRPR